MGVENNIANEIFYSAEKSEKLGKGATGIKRLRTVALNYESRKFQVKRLFSFKGRVALIFCNK